MHVLLNHGPAPYGEQRLWYVHALRQGWVNVVSLRSVWTWLQMSASMHASLFVQTCAERFFQRLQFCRLAYVLASVYDVRDE